MEAKKTARAVTKQHERINNKIYKRNSILPAIACQIILEGNHNV